MRKWIFFVFVAAAVVAADLATKAWALRSLGLGAPTQYAGGILPLTLHFNTGGLWGMGSGGGARWFFVAATAVALVVLMRLFRDVESDSSLRRWTLPMIAGGALGNLVDRLRWDRGVVDFLGPFDLGFMVWPIFNVADMAISCCTVLLVFSLWRQDLQSRPIEASQTVTSKGETSSGEAT